MLSAKIIGIKRDAEAEKNLWVLTFFSLLYIINASVTLSI